MHKFGNFHFLEILIDIEISPADNRNNNDGRAEGGPAFRGGEAVAHSIGGSGVSGDTRDPMQARVRILGTRLGRFVEFEFALYDGDLAVELILPTKAFEEFCQTRAAVVSTADGETAEAIEQMAWRAGHPGLLQRTAHGAARPPFGEHK